MFIAEVKKSAKNRIAESVREVTKSKAYLNIT
jgi:hypothetical protein